jgi:hypothetical protein
MPRERRGWISVSRRTFTAGRCGEVRRRRGRQRHTNQANAEADAAMGLGAESIDRSKWTIAAGARRSAQGQ